MPRLETTNPYFSVNDTGVSKIFGHHSKEGEFIPYVAPDSDPLETLFNL